MAKKAEMLAEYGESEAGQALRAKGFTAVVEGGVVVLRAQRYGVAVDVLDESTGMAPRFMTDAVTAQFHMPGDGEAAFVLGFPSVTALIAALELR